MEFQSLDHLSRVDQDSLSLFLDFLPFDWPISNLHTIPLERCAFLYALVTNASISFPYLFIHSLIEVHRSSSTTHGRFTLNKSFNK